jgi:2-alkenal reductase
MSRSSGWIVIIVILGIMLGVVGGGIMGGLVGMYVARNAASSVAAPVPQEIKSVSPGQAPIVQNMTVNSASEVIETVRAVEPAVVTVIANLGGSAFGQGNGQAEASGSGVVISQDGHIITNNHVIDGASSVFVIYSDGGRADATVVGADPVTDIAVLKVNGKVPAVVAFGDSSALQLGEWVIAIGSPLGNYRGSVTVGVVSGLNRTVQGTSQDGLIQTDAAINHGNSGGPLINLAGQIIGINTLVVRDTPGGDQAEGLGFAVPSNTVRSVAEQLIARGRIEYPFIGISYTEVTPQLAAEMNLNSKSGVVVTQITPGSPAQNAGLRARDVVVKINNDQINENNSLRSLLFKYRVGDTVTLTVERGGQTLQMQVTLVKRPA